MRINLPVARFLPIEFAILRTMTSVSCNEKVCAMGQVEKNQSERNNSHIDFEKERDVQLSLLRQRVKGGSSEVSADEVIESTDVG
jgi:hypothetical protein